MSRCFTFEFEGITIFCLFIDDFLSDAKITSALFFVGEKVVGVDGAFKVSNGVGTGFLGLVLAEGDAFLFGEHQ